MTNANINKTIERLKKAGIKSPEEVAKIVETQQKEAEVAELLKDYSAGDSVVEFAKIFEETKNIKYEYLYTKFVNLDQSLGGGFNKGNLVILTGLTGNGKTSFCFDLTRRMSNHNPFWLAYEVTAQEFAMNLRHYKQEPFHFYVTRITEESIDWIELKIMEAILKYKSEIVFIDNLHFITMSGEETNFAAQGYFAKRLKELALKLQIVIVLIAHLRKTKDGLLTKIPTFEDISGSSDIAKVADKVICVWRECKIEDKELKYTGKTKVAVQKVRQPGGMLRVIPFAWDRGIFSEATIEQSVAEFNNGKFVGITS